MSTKQRTRLIFVRNSFHANANTCLRMPIKCRGSCDNLLQTLKGRGFESRVDNPGKEPSVKCLQQEQAHSTSYS